MIWHGLDGALARAALYLGLTLLLSESAWQLITHTPVTSKRLSAGLFWSGAVSAFAALVLMMSYLPLNVVSSTPEVSVRSDFRVFWGNFRDVLNATSFSRLWSLQLGGLVGLVGIGALTRRQGAFFQAALVAFSFLTLVILNLTQGQHALFWSFGYWLSFLHGLFVALWLAALLVLIAQRLTGTLNVSAARTFSDSSLLFLIAIFVTGVVRAYDLSHFSESIWGSPLFMALFSAKLCLFFLLLWASRKVQGSSYDQNYDLWLSREVFLSILMMLASTTLAQIGAP